MTDKIVVSRYRLLRWLNIRKMTPAQMEQRVGFAFAENLEKSSEIAFFESEARALAETLSIDVAQLATPKEVMPIFLFQSAAELRQTCRQINRDGIHFYNYYSLPSPFGDIAPVILDILCPSDRLPKLNNGHLEPAITVNLGPGPIFGRWSEGETLSSLFRLDADPKDWIVGDSYIESPYCPHSYSLASQEPARIISYTAPCNLDRLIASINQWPDDCWSEFLEGADYRPSQIIQAILNRRGYTLTSLANEAGLTVPQLASLYSEVQNSLDLEALQRVADILGVDYRILLPAIHDTDRQGKRLITAGESRKSERAYGRYRVASMAHSTQLSDLSGLFMRIESADTDDLDICDGNAAHYFCTKGAVTFKRKLSTGILESVALTADDCIWVAPNVRHGFSGDGGLIKLGGRYGMSYLDFQELSNTHECKQTLERGRNDSVGWGYDK